ncbi:MAG: hypothetical protein AB1758_32505 [Candidatus Eremiobacterota bacterium]
MKRIAHLWVLVLAVGLVSWAGVKVAGAAAITNVTVSKGAKNVYVKVQAAGPIQYKVHHLPPGSDDYRNIVVDVWPAHIVAGKEPKARLAVDEGLVANVRVRQHGGGVRIFVDVVAWPRYQVMSDGHSVTLKIDAYHMRDKSPGSLK